MKTKKDLFQWDINQYFIECIGLYVDFPIGEEVVRVEIKSNKCLIPDEFLQTSGRKKVWECFGDGTIKEFNLIITERPKPPLYTFTATEKLTFDGLVQKVDDTVAEIYKMAYTGQLDGPKGDKGDKGDLGEPGPKGDPFTYEDFTPEQLANLVGPKGDKGDPGPKGDAFTYEDFTPDQLAKLVGPKGDKGDAFTYNDFTEEQLAALKGPKGDPGVAGSIVTVSATGTSEEEVQYITIDGVEKKLAGGGSKDAVLYTEQVLTDEQKAQARKNQDLPYITYEETALLNNYRYSSGTSAGFASVYFSSPYPDFSDFVKGQRFKIRVFDKDGTSGLDEICEYEMTNSTDFKSVSDTTDFIYFNSETSGYLAKNYIRLSKKDTASAGLSTYLYYSIIYDKPAYNSKLNEKLVDSTIFDNINIDTTSNGVWVTGKKHSLRYKSNNVLGSLLQNGYEAYINSSNVFGHGNRFLTSGGANASTVNVLGNYIEVNGAARDSTFIGYKIQLPAKEQVDNTFVFGTHNASLLDNPVISFRTNTAYSTGDIVSYTAGSYAYARMYKSLVDNNTNYPTDGSTNDYWEYLGFVFDKSKLFVLANGTNDENKSNALTIDKSGNADFSGTVASQGADYAEYFEWADGNVNDEDRVGYIVELDGDKIKLANQYTEDVLGIISAMPTVLGDTAALEWHGKYVKDKWGRIQYAIQDFIEEQQTVDEDGNQITEEVTISKLAPVINPDYDPDKAYYNRRSRKEWSTVGMLGKLYVRDDGTAEVNGYVKPAQGGIATKAAGKTNMRVLERVDENTIRVLLK